MYVPPVGPGRDWQSGDEIELPAAEAAHAMKVLRLRAGELVMLVDGLGTACRAELVTVSPKRVSARVIALIRDMGETRLRVTLAAGLSTASKFDSVVQRGTELGVKRFVPLITERSKVAIEDARRAKTRHARLTNVAIAALKQCRRSYLPEISLPTSFEDFLAQHDPSTLGLVFHAGPGGRKLRSVAAADSVRRLTLLVGPESGFTDEEVGLAVGRGFAQIDLGPRVLRTETAGPVVAALLMQHFGELS
jgi:16S rRNA (uracil1498-N3)-methyltransferase